MIFEIVIADFLNYSSQKNSNDSFEDYVYHIEKTRYQCWCCKQNKYGYDDVKTETKIILTCLCKILY